MNIDKYLARINYEGDLIPNLSTLRVLQKSHLLHLPFENLDIHSNTPIELNIDRIYEKLITKHRGGFCYELNGLFYELLKAIGYEVKRISGRVYTEKKGYGREYDHLAIIATVGKNDYLVDVGFGEFSFSPLILALYVQQEDERGLFMLDRYDQEYLRINKMENGNWRSQYIFKNIPRAYLEFQEMCSYHQTSPQSSFTQKKTISIPTQTGRITCSGNTLKIKNGEALFEEEINEQAYVEMLRKYFNFE